MFYTFFQNLTQLTVLIIMYLLVKKKSIIFALTVLEKRQFYSVQLICNYAERYAKKVVLITEIKILPYIYIYISNILLCFLKIVPVRFCSGLL